MEKNRYPIDWKDIAAGIKEKAGWKCEVCGKQCRKPGDPFDTHRNTLTVGLLNHTPEDCRPENLKAMCAPCHLEQVLTAYWKSQRNFPSWIYRSHIKKGEE